MDYRVDFILLFEEELFDTMELKTFTIIGTLAHGLMLSPIVMKDLYDPMNHAVLAIR